MVVELNRSTFLERLAERGGYLEVARLQENVPGDVLKAAGLEPDDLARIAGPDGVIRGSNEFDQLFREIDRKSGRLALDGPSGRTAIGVLYDAMGAQVDANRARTAAEGGRRFAGVPALDEVASGDKQLQFGDSGEGVTRVQRALVDIGYGLPTNGVSGQYDQDTVDAVKRFQREVGLPPSGKIDTETLDALAAVAPAPGQFLERNAEYDKLYENGRLDITIAVGFDENGSAPDRERTVLSGLRADGYKPIDRNKLDAAKRQELGLTEDRWDPNARYFSKTFDDPETKRPVTAVVRLLVAPSDIEGNREARESFRRALEQDEVVIYGGNARYGAGPEWSANEASGAYSIEGLGTKSSTPPSAGLRQVIDRDRTDLRSVRGRPDYQLLVFSGGRTEDYLSTLRDQGAFGRNAGNTDVIATTTPTSGAANGTHLVRFLKGITNRESNNSMLAAQNQIESKQRLAFGNEAGAVRANYTFTESGFFGNEQNRKLAS
jgi:peptidoglycan hydrolase-like protein with peptidoglycan-binding domain